MINHSVGVWDLVFFFFWGGGGGVGGNSGGLYLFTRAAVWYGGTRVDSIILPLTTQLDPDLAGRIGRRRIDSNINFCWQLDDFQGYPNEATSLRSNFITLLLELHKPLGLTWDNQSKACL